MGRLIQRLSFIAASLLALSLLALPAAHSSAEDKSLKEGATMYDAPKGNSVGRLSAGAKVQELKIQGDHALVLVEGWSKKSAFSKVPPLLARVKTISLAGENADLLAAAGGKSIGRVDQAAHMEMKNIQAGWVKIAFSGWVAASALGEAKVESVEPAKPPATPMSSPAPNSTDTPVLAQPADAAKPRVRISTTQGDIVVELDPAKASKTVENFLSYVRKGHYNGTIFHRVIENFMIQGGGFDAQYNEKPTDPPIPLESNNGLKNVRGAIAMARTPNPNSATSQFFINVVDNPNLDYPKPDGHGYAVFGRVVDGMEAVDTIRKTSTGNPAAPPPLQREAPQTMVVINSATIEK